MGCFVVYILNKWNAASREPSNSSRAVEPTAMANPIIHTDLNTPFLHSWARCVLVSLCTANPPTAPPYKCVAMITSFPLSSNRFIKVERTNSTSVLESRTLVFATDGEKWTRDGRIGASIEVDYKRSKARIILQTAINKDDGRIRRGYDTQVLY